MWHAAFLINYPKSDYMNLIFSVKIYTILVNIPSLHRVSSRWHGIEQINDFTRSPGPKHLIGEIVWNAQVNVNRENPLGIQLRGTVFPCRRVIANGVVVQLNESLCVSCKLCGIACPFGAIEFSGSRPLDIPANANTPKAPPAPPAPARVSTLLDWVPGIRAIAVKCDLCSFDEQGPACVRMCPTKALHLVDNTDIARVSKRKRELTFNTDFGDLTLFQQAQSGEAK